MKRLIVLVLLYPLLSWSQTEDKSILPENFHKVSSSKLDMKYLDGSYIVLEMGFNGSIPKNKLEKIQPQNIESITLAYSRYKLSESFDQNALNMQRMQKLYEQIPGIKKNKNINWFWVEQTGCKEAEACKDYFHGFIITLKSDEMRLYKETEIALLDYYSSIYEGMIDPRKMDSLISTGKLPYVKKCDTMTLRTPIRGNKLPKVKGWDRENNEILAKLLKTELENNDTINFQAYLNNEGDFLSYESDQTFIKEKRISRFLKSNLKVSPGKYEKQKVASKVYVSLFKNKSGYKINFKAFPYDENDGEYDVDKFLYVSKLQTVCDYLDTSALKVSSTLLSNTQDVVIKVFERNKDWKNCLVATDVTASMYPYIAQFQMWHKLHLDQNAGNHDFIFFNDGDNCPDIIKVDGNVGGLYYINTSSFEQLSITMKKAMLKGNGGDRPENNIEAIIEGLKKNPNIKEVIMIADNYATPRDLELLKQVKVPIHLILCGTQKGFNPEYLNMIKANKGSLHTMDQDLTDLSKLNEGQTIKIDDKTYKIVNGKFVMK